MTTSLFSTKPTLGVGSSGPAVTVLQQALQRLGNLIADAPGTFGSTTQQTVIAFQAQHGLEQDGRVGAATWAALEGALGQSLNIPGWSTPGVAVNVTPPPPAATPAQGTNWATVGKLALGVAALVGLVGVALGKAHKPAKAQRK